MQTQDIIKIIETSTVKQIQYELTPLSETLWTITGSLPTKAIQALHEADYFCYMAENEFFISATMIKETEN